MRDSRRTQYLIAFALLLIAGSLAVYATLLARWLLGGSPPAAVEPAKPPEKAASEDLLAARARFRQDFLDPASHVRLSEALRKAGQPIDSFYVLSAAKAFFPPEAFAAAHAAEILGAPEPPAAPDETALKDRLKADPEDPAALLGLARLLAAGGDPAQAHKYLDLGLSVHPDNPELLAAKARLLAPRDLMAAIPFFARLVHASPDSYEGRRALDELGRLAGEGDSGARSEAGRLAREGLEELLEVRPAHARIFSTMAMALWARGDLAAVRAMVSEASSKRPGHAGAAMVDGALALNDGETDRAIRRFTEAWERNPDDLYSADKLAQIYFKQRGDRESALPYLLALYRGDPARRDGEPLELMIQQILDARRRALVDRSGADGLGRHMRSDDASLRAEACAKAGEREDERWLESLAGLLDDDTEIVRHNADYALYRIARKRPGAVIPRRDDWLAALGPLGRVRVLNLFADLDRQGTLPLVLKALRDPSPVVRVLTKTMVLDRYYAKLPAASRAGSEYLSAETHPAARAILRRPGR